MDLKNIVSIYCLLMFFLGCQIEVQNRNSQKNEKLTPQIEKSSGYKNSNVFNTRQVDSVRSIIKRIQHSERMVLFHEEGLEDGDCDIKYGMYQIKDNIATKFFSLETDCGEYGVDQSIIVFDENNPVIFSKQEKELLSYNPNTYHLDEIVIDINDSLCAFHGIFSTTDYKLNEIPDSIIFNPLAREDSEILKDEFGNIALLLMKPEYLLREFEKQELIGIGELFLDISYPRPYLYGVDSEKDGVLIKFKEEELCFIWSKSTSDSLYEIQVLSEKINVGLDVKVRDSLSFFLKKYPKSTIELNVLTGESEYFTLEQNGFEYMVEVFTNDTNRIGYYTDNVYETSDIKNIDYVINKISIRR